jgi:hypothetical protein
VGNSAVGFLFGSGTWTAGSVGTNPSNGTVMVDTGQLAGSNYLVAVTGAGSVDWVYDLQVRDATNTSTVFSQRRRPQAGNEDFIVANKLNITANQRIRCVLVGSIVGELQMSLFTAEVG